ncbi:hypothetical protein [Noviherbaspirillum pedocola]|uniref:Uncharacterized protein n=1 Tax=Noviherbaspirillum pedocola TaxID=2801341 RepID=A0A934W8Q1_9BURK|nr:hypothetical protein [Noviherbaspirillum pedocola]MBK4736089.1 hypothetical protein [Noviherbaspirillum pedocola]
MISAVAGHDLGELFIDVSGLRLRGWTPRMIRNLLGTPDNCGWAPGQTASQHPSLYAIARVMHAENTDWRFLAERDLTATCSSRLHRAKGRAREKLCNVVEEIALPVLVEPLEDLLEAARLMQNFDAKWRLLSEERVALEMLSAKLASLAWQLDMYRGQAGIRSARTLLAQKIQAHIINRYPSLSAAATNADECAGAGTKGQQHENAIRSEQRDPDRH